MDETTQLIIAITGLVASIGTLIGIIVVNILTLRQANRLATEVHKVQEVAEEAKKVALAQTEHMDKIERATNGLKDELVVEVRKVERALGRKEGVAAERATHNQSIKGE